MCSKYLFRLLSIFSIAIISLIFGCKNQPDPLPSSLADSTGISQILDISALATSSIQERIPGSVIQHGHVWVQSSKGTSEPTISDSKTQLGTAQIPGKYSSKLNDLLANNAYKVRPYVQTNAGVIYGRTLEFTTEPDYIKRLVMILEDSLKNRGFGYSFVVAKRDEIVGSGSGGFQARRIEQGGERLVNTDTKMQIASMTKTLTAVAFLKLAKEKGIKTTDKIIDYLPPKWSKGENIGMIRFRDLLTHQSGIIGLNDNCLNGAYLENYWYGLQNIVAKGIRPQNYGSQCYQNANFGLFRVLIPSILGYKFSGDEGVDEEHTNGMYEEYMRENLMKKLGVASSDLLTNSSSAPTYGYDHPYTVGEYGFNPGDFRSVTGGYGFYLSANEAAKVYAGLFSTDDESVLSEAFKDSILTAGLGSYSTITPQGKYYYHDGWWYSGLGDGRPKGFRSIWMKCPDDITVVMFANALRHGDGVFPIKSDAYYDITSYVLWAFSEVHTPKKGGRSENINFHKYLKDQQPH